MNIFKQLFKSLYSPRDIAMFRFQGIGKTILYVFFLTLISILPSIYYLSSGLIDGVNEVEKSLGSELPPFYIDNGELHSEKEAPVILNKENFTIIFDSTGTVDTKELNNSKNTIAILKNDAYFIAGGQVQSLPYSMFSDLSITNDDLLGILATVNSSLGIIIPLLAAVILIFASGAKFIEVSFLALLGLFVKKMLNRNIQYRHTWRLAAYSVTLPTIFFTIMHSLQTDVPNGVLINWFVAYIMLFLTIKEIPQPKEKK
ncbi:DUF1189 domain-containing protein [Bacillus sp. DTU_2020_1000418_1_SI_GHA_SEK_038]|uniref:DUF1189 domain-containing protein n=1 Tax=Bacillus sp. DTU_2020_1000418_1_SI_GHA_SEK_038 TaxID=3077585 RepID=UPI0028E26633|nr:DUF1189 domain-containing protein [Bacillus sp. DTU_2020_1000418_1_SI_GHA_SEK_038]WNS74311.1 DUF1189 domain-containing protein [Bacillus sp. DTU_2020_1000418_1_SI_GHA_SEK_038]